MNKKLWTPGAERIANAPITAFMHRIEREYGIALDNDYHALHRWSVDQPEAFWQAVWDFTGVEAFTKSDTVVDNPDALPGARWFPQATLNFAANLLRFRGEQTALVSLLENGERRTLSRDELYREVARVADGLRAAGVQPGDRVAGFMPNIAETVVAMLAATSLGAVWTSCSPDFGINGVLDRFGQIEPRVLFAADAYYYNGKTCDCLERVQALCREVSSIETVVIVPLVGDRDISKAHADAIAYDSFGDSAAVELEFAPLPFDHPLYIMYSSGTTGVPKCIIHGAGGTLLQHLKEHRLQVGLGEGDVFFYYTTCGWMMWNWLVSGLACGATLVLYDGSPFAADGHLLLDAIDSE
ncbi:MAG: AMP-binding protein, partial [Chromatocurvus sp.]